MNRRRRKTKVWCDCEHSLNFLKLLEERRSLSLLLHGPPARSPAVTWPHRRVSRKSRDLEAREQPRGPMQATGDEREVRALRRCSGGSGIPGTEPGWGRGVVRVDGCQSADTAQPSTGSRVRLRKRNANDSRQYGGPAHPPASQGTPESKTRNAPHPPAGSMTSAPPLPCLCRL